jgi:hypothetical protein
MLSMGEAMAKHMRLERYAYTRSDSPEISIPATPVLDRLKESVSFSKDHLFSIAEYYSIDLAILEDFTIDEKDPELKNSSNETNPMLKRPILKNGEDFVFLLPTAQVNAIIEFIIDKAKEYNCSDKLMHWFNEYQAEKTREMCYENRWLQTDITLPPNNYFSDSSEYVFHFDNDKLAYVCFVKNNELKQPWEKFTSKETFEAAMKLDERQPELRERRQLEVLTHLDALNGIGRYKYFTVYVFGENGRSFATSFGAATGTNQLIGLNFSHFEKISQSDEIDSLTLWKFAKTFRETQEKVEILSFGETLDAYVSYKSNADWFLSSDDARPDVLVIAIGSGTDYERKIVGKMDEHAVFQNTEHGWIPVPVVRLRDFAPIYRERIKPINDNILLESYQCPIWVRTIQGKPGQESNIRFFSEAIAFWLHKMKPVLEEEFNKVDESPIEILLKLGASLAEFNYPIERNEIELTNVSIGISISNEQLILEIPSTIMAALLKPDNAAEKHIMRAVLMGIKKLIGQTHAVEIFTDELILGTVETFIQPSSAKMILFVDIASNIRLDNRWLAPVRTIQENDSSRALENLVAHINPSSPIPERIEVKKEKNELCNKIVAAFLKQLTTKLNQFNATELLQGLMKLHEACIQQREFREIHIPAKIACFSDYPTEVEKLFDEDRELVTTTIAIRALIEFIAADPQFGTALSNTDDTDELLALTDQIISWGMFSDAIAFDLDDPIIGLLPSSRIGTNKSFWEDNLKPFGKAKVENDVFEYQNSFERKFERNDEEETLLPGPEVSELDAAFESEFGLTVTELATITGDLIKFCIDNNTSVFSQPESELKGLLWLTLPSWPPDKIEKALNYLSLSKRESVTKAPKGYDKTDIYPWKYNRELSYLRKPLVRLEGPTGPVYFWSFRHMYDSLENLNSLINTGRLKAKEGNLLDRYLAKMNGEKGDAFRKLVVDWFTSHTEFKVILYEVKITPTGHLIADKDYGDIDVLVVDEKEKIIYPIECKNTVKARVIHEMKTELDKYLGVGGKPGMIQKHVDRDIWLKANVNQLSVFVTSPEQYQIRSLILTYENIPITYLTKHKLPLPVLSYKELIRVGIQLFIKEAVG